PAALSAEGGDNNPLVTVSYTSDGKRLVATAWSGLAYVWNAQTGSLERSLAIGDGPLQSLAIDPNNRWIALGGKSAGTLVNLETGETIRKLPAEAGVAALAVRPTDGLLAVQHAKEFVLGRIDLWDVDAGTKQKPITGQSGISGPMAFSSDGKVL